MKNNVVIIGMGNLGRRHLQAVNNYEPCEDILGCDTQTASLEMTQKFCDENHINTAKLTLTSDLKDVEKKIGSHTVVIVATTANDREKILSWVIERKPLAVLAEKPVCQTEEKYKALLDLNRKYQIPVFIDFDRYLYDYYQDIYSYLKGVKQRSFHALTWGGMACVGIHVLELICWLYQVKDYEFIHCSKPRIFDSKRKGFQDFEADIVFKINKDVICSVSAKEDENLQTFTITTEDRQYFINQSAEKMIVVDKGEGQKEVKIYTRHVSQLTDKVLASIVSDINLVKLPKIEDSFMSHKILFDYMKMHKIDHLNFT